jgi:hypothetical protein
LEADMTQLNWFYQNREERSRWLVERFNGSFKNSESVLDVGCHEKDLGKYLPENISNYVGIDMGGTPDFKINLDKIEKLPFKDNEFDLIVCSDVLEHLENIHLIYDELCRVSKKYIILTLPNSMAQYPGIIKGTIYTDNLNKKKEFGKYMKFYGLPLEVPEDRHRWYFNFEEAKEFVEYRSKKNDLTVKTIDSEWNYIPFSFKKFLLYIFKLINNNFVHQNFICLLEKSHRS